MGQHRPGFPRVLYDTLHHLGYNGDAPVYRGRMSMAHGQDKCEVNVVMPLNLTEPWMATIIGVELDETVEQTAQVALTSLCESRLADTAVMPITLFLIHNQENPVWKQRLEAVSNPEEPHFHTGMAALAGYAQHMFNLQASTGRTVMRQHLHSSSLGIAAVRLHLQTRTLSSRRGQRRLPISSSSFRCFSFRCRLHPQRLQHPLSPMWSRLSTRSKWRTCWEGRVD
jgi:hypothetical protein